MKCHQGLNIDGLNIDELWKLLMKYELAKLLKKGMENCPTMLFITNP